MQNKKTWIFCFMLVNIIVNFTIFIIPVKKPIVPNPSSLNINFTLNNIKNNTLEVNQIYEDPGVIVTVDETNYASIVKINQTQLKTNHLNTYYISYTLPIGTYRTEQKFRKVTVVDTKGPTLSLEGPSVMKLSPGTEYKEPGYEATDNFDGDVTKLVKIDGSVDYNKEGTYILTYKASDKRGNETIKTRTIIIQIGVLAEGEEEKGISFDPTIYQNTLTEMKYTESGLSVKGYIKNSNQNYTINLKGPIQKKVEMKKIGTNNYKGDLELAKLPNGLYEVQTESNKKEDLLVKLEETDRPIRAHIGNKLVTFTYQKDKLKIKIEKFKYKYDVVIDPGHGGTDTGTTVNGITEKKLNLEVSLYEKKRYEEHGLNVYLIRTDDSYGEMLGNKEWQPITKRAYTVGYYGTLSKYTYSNHHNSIEDPNFMGWELLVPSRLNEIELKEEYAVLEAWNNVYPPKENHTRMYARNYETGGIYNKINGQVYGFKDYYAVNRMSLSNFNVKAPIYETIYMSNPSDFEWYYTKENYKKMSESKIKVYVESLGKTYKSPKEGA